jgi:hypothetical protein
MLLGYAKGKEFNAWQSQCNENKLKNSCPEVNIK